MCKRGAIYAYLPLIPRLKLLYASKEWAEKMRYGARLSDEAWENDNGTEGSGLRDIWHGSRLKYLKKQGRSHHEGWLTGSGYSRDERNVALHFSTDGVHAAI
jgi:hypothetical protein